MSIYQYQFSFSNFLSSLYFKTNPDDGYGGDRKRALSTWRVVHRGGEIRPNFFKWQMDKIQMRNE